MIAGAKVAASPDLSDAIFLADHTGWSWDDLQAAPADIVDIMRLLEEKRSEARRNGA